MGLFLICVLVIMWQGVFISNETHFRSHSMEDIERYVDARVQSALAQHPGQQATDSALDKRIRHVLADQIGKTEKDPMHVVKKVNDFPNVQQLSDIAQRRILVTGGAGFVGSHLVDRLMEEGHLVIVLDNLFTGKRRNIEKWIGHPNFEFVVHDVVTVSLA